MCIYSANIHISNTFTHTHVSTPVTRGLEEPLNIWTDVERIYVEV